MQQGPRNRDTEGRVLALPTQPPRSKLLDQLRQALRSHNYSRRTAQNYFHREKRFIVFHDVRHPTELAEPEINAFLTNVVVKDKVSEPTQNQALSAFLFLYRHLIGQDAGDLGGVIRAPQTRAPPRGHDAR